MARHTVVLFQHFALFRQKMTASAVQTAMAAAEGMTSRNAVLAGAL